MPLGWRIYFFVCLLCIIWPAAAVMAFGIGLGSEAGDGLTGSLAAVGCGALASTVAAAGFIFGRGRR